MKVAIFFGSKSDTETMKKAAAVLGEFGVEYKAFVISAHRAGELLRATVSEVENQGFEVIIAGAGLAAALPVRRELPMSRRCQASWEHGEMASIPCSTCCWLE